MAWEMIDEGRPLKRLLCLLVGHRWTWTGSILSLVFQRRMERWKCDRCGRSLLTGRWTRPTP